MQREARWQCCVRFVAQALRMFQVMSFFRKFRWRHGLSFATSMVAKHHYARFPIVLRYAAHSAALRMNN